MGDQEGTIIAHGTDTDRTGKPLIWISVRLAEGDELTAKAYLSSDKGEEQTKTAIRMARSMLKLCGFDPDVSNLEDLDNVPKLLVGNVVPVNVSKNGNYTNVNIQRPRGIKREQAASLTEALRAAKSKDEPAMTKPTTKPSLGAPIEGVDDSDVPF